MGAGRLYTFRRVTLPLVRNGLVSAALFGFLLSFDELVIALFLADIDTRTLPVKMYESIKYEISPVLAAVSTLAHGRRLRAEPRRDHDARSRAGDSAARRARPNGTTA